MKKEMYVTPEMEVMEIESDICTTLASQGTSNEADVDNATNIGDIDW